MNYSDIEEKLKQLKVEDFIWLIYIFIIFLSWYSNDLERDYFINKNEESKDKYRKTIIFIFLVLTIVYTYFLKNSIDDIRGIKPTDTDEKKSLIYLSFLGSLLIFISGLIFLYIAFKDKNIDVELAFN